jgi:uncharacterized protein (TIGR03067 family)
MKRFLPALLLVVAGTALADDAAAKKYLKDIEGTYTATTLTKGGEAAPDDFIKAVSIIIEKDTLTFSMGKGKDRVATVVVDPAQKPVAFDLTPKDGPDAGKPMLGIIKVEKDVITLCFPDSPTAARPKEFASPKGSEVMILVLKKK